MTVAKDRNLEMVLGSLRRLLSMFCFFVISPYALSFSIKVFPFVTKGRRFGVVVTSQMVGCDSTGLEDGPHGW